MRNDQRVGVSFRRRPLAITDLETTGLDPKIHDILEIGLIVVDQVSLAILDTLELKVRPEHIETASPSALLLNGYNERDWCNAVSLKEAMLAYSSKSAGAVFCSHNVTFDWAFSAEAFSRTGVKNEMDYCPELEIIELNSDGRVLLVDRRTRHEDWTPQGALDTDGGRT